jgi:hypothetical protein
MMLDQPKPERAPATWTGDLVRQRLVEAFAIMRRMPGQGVRRIGSAWPAAVLHDFRDMLHWTDARERVLDDWENTKGTYPYEVTRMDEALSWLEWLDEGERRCVNAWAFTASRGISLTRELKKRKWSRSTFYRQVERAAQRIADRLNNRGVQVR